MHLPLIAVFVCWVLSLWFGFVLVTQTVAVFKGALRQVHWLQILLAVVPISLLVLHYVGY